MSSIPGGKADTARRCSVCGLRKSLSSELGVCGECLSFGSKEALRRALEAHKRSRLMFNLPVEPPHLEAGLRCEICANECVIPPGRKGYCGLAVNDKGKMRRLAGTPDRGLLEFYYDSLPTNCVADWCCPAGTGAGYPKFAHYSGPEYGYFNLAVFYGACSFDCLFCQNWHYRENTNTMAPMVSAETLAGKVSEKVSCICYFGGDPAPQLPHSIRTSEIALEKSNGRILRICWETNGSENWALLRHAADLAMSSGGCIKFDLKTFSESLNIGLCGVSNSRTIENFKRLSDLIQMRPEPPFLVASTLLIPGYVEVEEIRRIADLIAECDPTIPYCLLAFSPQYLMDDLPTTSLKMANECVQVAKMAGLKRVRIGNANLLS